MSKNSIYIITIFMLCSFNANSQEEVLTIGWEKPTNCDFIIRPHEVSSHAFLFESDQVNFKVYYWVEYIVKLDSDIHKMKLYEKNGLYYETKYYFTLDSDNDFSVDTTKKYVVEDAISNVITVKTKENAADFYLFNYFADDDSYKPNVDFKGSINSDYLLVTTLSDNPNFGKAKGISKLTHEIDSWINIENGENGEYKVVIQDEFGKFTTANYLFKCNHENGTIPSFPFHIKYYHKNTGNIFLINKDYWLEKVE